MRIETTPFDGRAFLDVAKDLAHDDATEAQVRTAIGRAYYAVFLAHAEEISKDLGIHPHALKHHTYEDRHGLINEIGRVYNKPILNQYAEKLYQWRIAADYRPTNPAHSRQAPNDSFFITAAEAKDLIRLAESIFTATGK
jgi:hypothetical protein